MSSSPSKADKRLLMASLIVFALTCIGSLLVLLSNRDKLGGRTTPPTATFETNEFVDSIMEDLTQLPQATPLTGELAEKINALDGLIKTCPDYTNERRAQVEQHLAWLRDPATLPEQMIIALGGKATEGLLRGIGTFTLSDWGLKERAPSSCLLPIGQQTNVLIIEQGGEAIPAFAGVEE